MTITRPYGAEDNNINTAQRDMLERYTAKIGETISEIEVYEQAIQATTTTGRKLFANITDIYSRERNLTKYIYLKEEINNKQVRIPKSKW